MRWLRWASNKVQFFRALGCSAHCLACLSVRPLVEFNCLTLVVGDVILAEARYVHADAFVDGWCWCWLRRYKTHHTLCFAYKPCTGNQTSLGKFKLVKKTRPMQPRLPTGGSLIHKGNASAVESALSNCSNFYSLFSLRRVDKLDSWTCFESFRIFSGIMHSKCFKWISMGILVKRFKRMIQMENLGLLEY